MQGTWHGMSQEREMLAHAFMVHACFSFVAIALSTSCEAGGGGHRLAPPAPRRSRRTWRAAVVSKMERMGEDKHKQCADTICN